MTYKQQTYIPSTDTAHAYSIAMPETSIVLVPGFWEGPSVYTPVLELLRQDSDYSVIVGVLPSTGVPSPGNPTLADDTTTIRCLIESQINGDKDVVLVLHSAGGYIGCNAIQGLTAKERTGRGLKGGVKRIVFLCAGIFEKGSTTGFMPFFDIKVSKLRPMVAEESSSTVEAVVLIDRVVGRGASLQRCTERAF